MIINRNKFTVNFTIDENAPNDWLNSWINLVGIFSTTYNSKINVYLNGYRKVLNFCKLESNKILPLLNRSDGGAGGNSNINDKQIRFNSYDSYKQFSNACKLKDINKSIKSILSLKSITNDKQIELNQLVKSFKEIEEIVKLKVLRLDFINPDNKEMPQWTIEEIEDFCDAFKEMCSNYEVISEGNIYHLNDCINSNIVIDV